MPRDFLLRSRQTIRQFAQWVSGSVFPATTSISRNECRKPSFDDTVPQLRGFDACPSFLKPLLVNLDLKVSHLDALPGRSSRCLLALFGFLAARLFVAVVPDDWAFTRV